jgi:hypothetical protein
VAAAARARDATRLSHWYVFIYYIIYLLHSHLFYVNLPTRLRTTAWITKVQDVMRLQVFIYIYINYSNEYLRSYTFERRRQEWEGRRVDGGLRRAPGFFFLDDRGGEGSGPTRLEPLGMFFGQLP